MSKNMYLIVDTSNSIKRPTALSAEGEVIEKIYNDIITNQIDDMAIVDNVFFYKCGQGKWNKKTLKWIKKISLGKWLPKELDCSGTAFIIQLLEKISQELIVTNKNIIVVISDGYWCGSAKTLNNLEIEFFTSNKAKIVEVNIGTIDMWNTIQGIHLFSTDEKMTNTITQLLK